MTRLSFFAVCLFMLMLTGICLAQDTGAQQDTGERHGRGQGQHGRGGAMMRMDTDNDGKISREEWKGKPEAFDKIDKNGDGFITKEELAESRRNRFEEMDTNNDGKISRDEWKGNPKIFTRLDTNNDGVLTKEELKAGARKGGKQQQQ